jgi:hypothetical protein
MCLINDYCHAVLGPDHLAALIAPSVGKSGLTGLKIGALWGIGHGISALTLGLCAFFLKGQFTGRFAVLEKLATAAESVVGLSILFIGVMGVRESLERHEDEPVVNSVPLMSAGGGATSLSTAVPSAVLTAGGMGTAAVSKYARTYRAIFANGALHGFSWDGAPSLAPAIAMTSWRGAASFLLSYTLGTVITMSLAAGAMSELSMRVGQVSDNPDLPRKLSLVSSVAAVAIGLYLTAKSTILR